MTQASSPEEVAVFRDAVLAKLTYAVGKDPESAFDHDWFEAIALATRDRLVDHWMEHTRQAYSHGRKRVYYLSLEFLMGRLLVDSLNNLGLLEVAREAMAALSVDFERVRRWEPDAALGNGGLGRLAACFMESMSTLGIVAHGYGIRYEHGLFRQRIIDGWQHEQPENWLDFGNPWEFERPEVSYPIGFGGHVESTPQDGGESHYHWVCSESVRAIAYDTPVAGWKGLGVNTLRLWRARAEEEFHLERFNAGDYLGAVEKDVWAESISRVLYPADDNSSGQELRLRQEFFFVSASLQDLLRRHLRQFPSLDNLPEFNAIQLNDTHPAIAVAELMRLLVDIHDMPWKAAWERTVATLSYTNHTLLPEALETWPVALMERLLPRHMQIIYLINAYHLDALRAKGLHDFELLRATSLIDEEQGRRVRMGNLAFIGSHSVNGVSALHTGLMRETVFLHLHSLYPQRINSKTNGITFRRWLYEANPQLTQLLVETLGESLLDTPEVLLPQLVAHAEDAEFRAHFAAQRLHNKRILAHMIKDKQGIDLNPEALFDVHVKRIHEYKRQLLNVLHTVALYQAIRVDPGCDWVPRVKIFAGKAAASYHQAKLIIKLINDVAQVVNHDPTVRGLLKVVFMPNYNVSKAERIIPAADLSEQISTAGMEASGTSNMKFALNGALTIGTLDGANVEMSERIGLEHMFIFGMNAAQVEERRHSDDLSSAPFLATSPRLMEAIRAIREGVFSPDDPSRYHHLVDDLIRHDPFMVCADFEAYWHEQQEVENRWRDPATWWRSALLNTAQMGWFSSDRTIYEYATDIWNVAVPGAMGRDFSS